MKEIWFEKQKDKEKIRGTAGVRTGICWTQVYIATAVRNGGFNRVLFADIMYTNHY
jgi:hypothetical protein